MTPRFSVQLLDAATKLQVWRYEIYLVSDWDFDEDEVPENAAIQHLAATDRPGVAETLHESWVWLAPRHYGRGYVVCVDDRGRRVGGVLPTRHLPPR